MLRCGRNKLTTIPNKRRGRYDGLLGPPSDVGGNQRPGEEQCQHERDGDEVKAPLGPLILGCVG